MDENSNSGTVEITKNNHVNEDHGWKTVTYHKKSKSRPQKPNGRAAVSAATADGVPSDRRSDVFRLIEQHSEERHRKWLEDQRAAAVATGDYPVVVDYGDGDDGSDGEGPAAGENGVGGAEEKKSKPKKPKKPKVTVSEAASKIDSSDLAAFLADISVSYETQQDIQLMRFADYFGRAFAKVSGSQFPWMKMLKESSVVKMVDIPVASVSESVYKTSTDWLNQRSIEALGSFVLWSLDSILYDLAGHQGATKGAKKVAQQASSKSQVAIFLVLAMVLRRKPDVLISLLPILKENAKYQGQDKLPVLVWVITQAIGSTPVTDSEQIEFYVLSSIKSAYLRLIKDVEMMSDSVHEHPLALLAEHTKIVLKKDATMYMPILSQRHPNAVAVSASLLHKLYGIKLKPFVDGAEHLTEDVVAVFPAADHLEQYVVEVIMSYCKEETGETYCNKLNLYKIETTSGTLVMRWLNSQIGRIIGWVERAIEQESWVPVSPQQRHGSSIIEVYRIVEETVDQFFALKVPMRSGELSSLVRGIDNAFQVYAKNVVNQLAKKEDIIPPLPILTRYSKEGGIKALVKKELRDPKLNDMRKSTGINVLATPTLCVQLNTLYYAVSQLTKLEDNICERWTRKKSQYTSIRRPTERNFRSSTQKERFDGGRKDINAAIDQICEFTGTKIVFWDLREPFIENLYKPRVSQSRLETLIDPLDLVLNQLCDVIVEPLRDRVVTGLLQASLDGLLRVILDGGASRVFSVADAKLMEEDLEVLKEFFISGGDGLPRGVVENQVAGVRQVIKLHSYETRELIEDLKSASGLELQGGTTKFGTDAKTLLRILCHRSDSEASQFLKKHYKIPKPAA